MDMTPEHKQWKKFTLTGDALSAAWWPCPPSPGTTASPWGLNLFILIWITPPGLNVTNAIPPFIYSVGPGNQLCCQIQTFSLYFFCCRQF